MYQSSAFGRPIVAAITTIKHNVGDDFVREGIIYLLRHIVPQCQVFPIHKHQPITVRPEWEWFYTSGCCRLLDYVPGISGLGVTSRLDRLLPLSNSTDKILNCDLLVQCGAPVYWLSASTTCALNEWYSPLIRRRWSVVRDRVPFLNLGAGTCQDYYSDGSEFKEDAITLNYIRQLFDDAKITTVRDKLAGQILQIAGREAAVIPCPSIFARFEHNIVPRYPRYVVLNYMPRGGHYGRTEAAQEWEKSFTSFVAKLPRDEAYKVVCHNRTEVRAARKLFPNIDIFWSNDFREYLKVFAEAKYGIVNRVHAAFALASFGRPSFVVGSDSRARMADMIEVKHSFVEKTTKDVLLSEYDRLRSSWGDYSHVMSKIHAETKQSYIKLLSGVFPKQVGNG